MSVKNNKDDLEVLCKDTDDQKVNKSFASKTILALTCFLLLFYLLMTAHLCSIIADVVICGMSSEICRSNSPIVPEQLHLSLGANDSEYYVTWSTMEPADTYLFYSKGPDAGIKSVLGLRVDGIFESTDVDSYGLEYKKYSYRARMQVERDTQYHYKVVSCEIDDDECEFLTSNTMEHETSSHSSEVYKFQTKSFDDTMRPLNFLFYGDLGLLNAQSVPRLTKEIEHGDLIIHNGDFAYDLNTDHGKYGDRFMRLIEPIAARIPYLTSVGNHEIAGNFSEYNHRFTMINRGNVDHGNLNNFYYSFNAGPIHFIAFSTEFYYFLKYCGLAPLSHQYNWLVEDLKHAASPGERAQRPWIVVFGHRPMYCSSDDEDDCTKDSNLLRRGLPSTGAYALEKLFYDHGVDVELYSHEHQYERFLPIYDGHVFNTTQKDPYFNPGAPVHVISGSAGCQEKLDPFKGTPTIGSVKRISDYGYTRVKATRCTLEFEQVSDDQYGTVVDRFVIRKDHQSFPKNGIKIEGC